MQLYRTRILGVCCLALLTVQTTPLQAAEPMPPIMQSLLHIYPERNGWFVEEPLTVHPQTPEKARPFFETFRVVVPDINALDLAVGKLLAAANTLPIRKITRYDRKPNAPGLPGFRGVWCRTEDEDAGGFSIITSNQNRFLIWARYQYYEAWDNDEIKPKVRDWYARSLGQYFASLDTGVPDTEPPRAVSRTLPEWFDVYPPIPEVRMNTEPGGRYAVLKKSSALPYRRAWEEIRAWGLAGIVQFQPTQNALQGYIETAPDTLWPNREIVVLQHDFRHYEEAGFVPGLIRTLAQGRLPSEGSRGFLFAVDRYGRVRYVDRASVRSGTGLKPSTDDNLLTTFGVHGLLFPAAPILTGGYFHLLPEDDGFVVGEVAADAAGYFYPTWEKPDSVFRRELSDRCLETLGHFFNAMATAGLSLNHVAIRKFSF